MTYGRDLKDPRGRIHMCRDRADTNDPIHPCMHCYQFTLILNHHSVLFSFWWWFLERGDFDAAFMIQSYTYISFQKGIEHAQG